MYFYFIYFDVSVGVSWTTEVRQWPGLEPRRWLHSLVLVGVSGRLGVGQLFSVSTYGLRTLSLPILFWWSIHMVSGLCAQWFRAPQTAILEAVNPLGWIPGLVQHHFYNISWSKRVTGSAPFSAEGSTQGLNVRMHGSCGNHLWRLFISLLRDHWRCPSQTLWKECWSKCSWQSPWCAQDPSMYGRAAHLRVQHPNPGFSASASISISQRCWPYGKDHVNQDSLHSGESLCRPVWWWCRDFSRGLVLT